jgi:hypothetical protein
MGCRYLIFPQRHDNKIATREHGGCVAVVEAVWWSWRLSGGCGSFLDVFPVCVVAVYMGAKARCVSTARLLAI